MFYNANPIYIHRCFVAFKISNISKRIKTIRNQLTPGDESFLKSRQSLSYSRISQNFMAPQSSLPCSQVPSADFYPEPHYSSPYNAIMFL
jgi:hypothetical protein